MIRPDFDPQAQLSDIESRLVRLERGISITSVCALALVLSAYAGMPL